MSAADDGLGERNTDADELCAVAHGDKAAFTCLFHRFAPRLKRYLLKLGLSDSTADELTQEIMLTVWRKAPQFDPNRASASAWIFTIARNRRVDTLRRERVRPDPRVPEPVDDPVTPEQELRTFQGRQHVRQAMNTLPHDQAELMRLSFYEEKSHAEIAGDLGLPLGTVKSRIRRAAATLRTTLGGWA